MLRCPVIGVAGKLLPGHVTEVRVIFKRPPKLAFASASAPDPDELVLRIDPAPGIDPVVQAKQPGADTTRTVDLSLVFAEELGEAPQPYERLLGDAVAGDSSLFTREDSVEETWRIVQPLLDTPPPVEVYQPGSMGPGQRRQAARRPPELARPVDQAPRVVQNAKMLFHFPRPPPCRLRRAGGPAGAGARRAIMLTRPDQRTMRRASNGGQPRCTSRAI